MELIGEMNVEEYEVFVEGLGLMYKEDLLSVINENIGMQASFLEAFNVLGVYLVGSRINGTNRDDSDLDVVIVYEGDIKEDRLSIVLNSYALHYDGLEFDFLCTKKSMEEIAEARKYI
ncbi:TPA: nucleotidyltransferase domain-containing protein, partial [Bacillus cereus]|nr:nucleotidyltransferase domain-containing protein [Bacillus cereus]HDR8338417.1 nucleotidyltransferase domain-containing protein [Bacillus cereus]